MSGVRLGCTILAHTDPEHLHRLVDALPDGPVFLHCDSATKPDVHRAMVEGHTRPVELLPRRRTSWGSWAAVLAELDGYRAALRHGLSHCIVLSGADYPIAPGTAIHRVLGAEGDGASLLDLHPLPRADWGPTGGWFRLHHQWATIRGVSVRPLWRRRLYPGLSYHSAGVGKVLARPHMEALLRVADATPALERFFARALLPDELFVPTVVKSPLLVGSLADSVRTRPLWHIDWVAEGDHHPRWLDDGDFATIRAAATGPSPLLFARKLSVRRAPALVERIDQELRSAGAAAQPIA